MSLEEYFVAKIRMEMFKMGLNKSQVARACDYSRSTVDNYLTGRFPISIRFIEQFCRIYSLEFSALSNDFTLRR